MSNERYNQIIDEVYLNYSKKYFKEWESGMMYESKESFTRRMMKEQFINKCKTDSEFSEKWGLKIEERELSLEERFNYGIDVLGYLGLLDFGTQQTNDMIKFMDVNNVPTKLITLTYNNETVESYE